MMKQAVWTALFFSIALSALAAEKRPAREQAKIDWLLAEVEHSDAAFIRNGSEYDGRKAADHLKSKLWWAGKRVQTAREFIVGVASHSEASGKPYEIRLRGGASQPLQKWLLERLQTYEKGRRDAAP